MFDQETIDYLLASLEEAVQNLPLPIVTAMPIGNPWVVLVTTILSLRTRDQVTGPVARDLLKLAPDPLTLLELGPERLADLIRRVGFYNTKAANLRKIAEIILSEHGGEVPDDLETLLTLPGVGRKTANLVLIQGYDKEGLCVDIHVHRIANRLGLVETKNPDATEFALREVLPRRWWKPINGILVAWGQSVCQPRVPACSRCPISAKCQRRGVVKSK